MQPPQGTVAPAGSPAGHGHSRRGPASRPCPCKCCGRARAQAGVSRRFDIGAPVLPQVNSLHRRAGPVLCPIIPAPSPPHRHLPQRRAAMLPPRGPPNLGETRGHPSPVTAAEPPASAQPPLQVPGPARVPVSLGSSGTGSTATHGPHKVSPWAADPTGGYPEPAGVLGTHPALCSRPSAGAAHRVPRDRQRLRGLGGQQGVPPRAHPRAPSPRPRVRQEFGSACGIRRVEEGRDCGRGAEGVGSRVLAGLEMSRVPVARGDPSLLQDSGLAGTFHRHPQHPPCPSEERDDPASLRDSPDVPAGGHRGAPAGP